MHPSGGEGLPRVLLIVATCCLGGSVVSFIVAQAEASAAPNLIAATIALIVPLILAGVLGLAGVVLLGLYFIATARASSRQHHTPNDVAP